MTKSCLQGWTSPPGETIADLISEKGLSEAELGALLGCTATHVSRLLDGTAAIDVAMATALSLALGSTADFWLARETQYREALASHRNQ